MQAEEEWHDTIIIHPGSRNLRIGLASEAYPITIPHVIGRRIHKKKQENNNNSHTNSAENNNNNNHSAAKEKEEENNMEIDDDKEDDDEEADSKSQQYYDALKEMRSELTWRMKNAKRRTLPNADNQVISFNSQAPMETILDHNDPYRVEWIDVNNGTVEDVFVGDKALRLPLNNNDNSDFQLFYPWKNGTLNHYDYASLQAVIGDLQTIWTSAIHNELGIEDNTFEVNINITILYIYIYIFFN